MHSSLLARGLVSGILGLSGLVVLVACSDSLADPTQTNSGALRARVAVFGTEPDPDGYLVVLGTGEPGDPAPQSVGSTGGTVFFGNLPSGTYATRLESLAANCVVDGDNPHPSSVVAGETSLIGFAVVCPKSPMTEVFKHVRTDPFVERYFVEADGTFALDFGSQTSSSAEYLGTYSRDGGTFFFDFDDGSGFGNDWLASATLLGDCITVDYNDAMEFDDFEDGEYCR